MRIKQTLSFPAQVYALTGSIALICLVLAGLTWLQGPRVRSAAIDTTAVTTLTGQQLLLHLNQPLGTITDKHVHIKPKATFKATSGGNTIAIQFTQPLLNGTRYHVRVQTPDKRHEISYSFATPSAAVYYVTESADGDQAIRKRQLGGNADEVVFSGGQIDDFVVLDNLLIIAEKYGDGTRLLSYNTANKQRKIIDLPGEGTITQLRSAPGRQTVGLLYTDYERKTYGNVWLYDVNTAQPRRIMLAKDSPLEATNWRFAKNGTTILAQTFDSTAFLVNPDTAPIPLGQFASLFGFSFNDRHIALRDQESRAVSIDVTTMEQIFPFDARADVYLAELLPLNTREGYVLQAQSFAGDTPKQDIQIRQQNKSNHLLTAGNNEYITNLALSPNDQYLAIEKGRNGSTHPYSQIIDMRSGEAIATLEASKVRWSNGP